MHLTALPSDIALPSAIASATGTGSAAQRCPALGSAASAAGTSSAGQCWAAVCRYSRCPAVKKARNSAALKSL